MTVPTPVGYVLITPAKSEAKYIGALIESVIAQTILPMAWVIINDGSTDDTGLIVQKYAEAHPFILPLDAVSTTGRSFASKARAFCCAYEKIKNLPFEFIGNLDADVTLEPNYYELVLTRMRAQTNLGTAGGVIWDKVGSTFQRTISNRIHTPGAIMLFRRECFEEIGGYRPVTVGGVDSMAVLTARMKGWETISFDDLPVFHHKPEGSSAGNAFRRCFRDGLTEYHMGTRPLFAIVKAIRRLRERPFILGSMVRVTGYLSAWVKRVPETPHRRCRISWQRNSPRGSWLISAGENPESRSDMFDPRRAVTLGMARLAYGVKGLPVFRNHSWLRRTDSWSQDQREQWRLERLNKMVSFAWKHVPFYREFWSDHHISQSPIRHIEELQTYPVLTKEIYRANDARVRPENISDIRHFPKHSGGTTGQPIHYWEDMDHWALMQGFQLYGWSLAGYRFGDRVGVMAGGSLLPERTTWKGIARNLIERKLFLFGVSMDRCLAKEYHGQLMRFGAEFLYGYPSIIYLFGRHLAEQNLSLPSLRAVVTTAEMLYPNYRAGIEENLGCPVFNNLGCNDGGYESFECHKHQGLHYNDLQSVLEVQTDKPGSAGPLLLTNLWNRATPFIRYANGDLVTLRRRCVSVAVASRSLPRSRGGRVIVSPSQTAARCPCLP